MVRVSSTLSVEATIRCRISYLVLPAVTSTVYACLWWYWRFFFRQFNFDNIFCEEKRIQTSSNIVYSNSQLINFLNYNKLMLTPAVSKRKKQFYKMWNYVQPKIIDEIFFEDNMKKVIYCRKCPTPKTVKCSFFKALKQVHAWLIFLKKCCM